jgi:hypothetical protein
LMNVERIAYTTRAPANGRTRKAVMSNCIDSLANFYS